MLSELNPPNSVNRQPATTQQFYCIFVTSHSGLCTLFRFLLITSHFLRYLKDKQHLPRAEGIYMGNPSLNEHASQRGCAGTSDGSVKRGRTREERRGIRFWKEGCLRRRLTLSLLRWPN